MHSTFAPNHFSFVSSEGLFCRNYEAKSQVGAGGLSARGDRQKNTHSASLHYDTGPLDNVLTSSAHLIGDWEGPEGLEEIDEATLVARAEELKSTRTHELQPEPVRAHPPPPDSESEGDDPSSDEYVADGKGDPKRTTAKVRPTLERISL